MRKVFCFLLLGRRVLASGNIRFQGTAESRTPSERIFAHFPKERGRAVEPRPGSLKNIHNN